MSTQITNFGRNGVSDWLVQRATAVICAAYAIVLVGYLVLTPEVTYQQWKDLFSHTGMQIFTLITLLAICAHAWIGMWTTGTDYLRVHTMGEGADRVRFIYQIICILVLFVYLTWGFKILWGSA